MHSHYVQIKLSRNARAEARFYPECNRKWETVHYKPLMSFSAGNPPSTEVAAGKYPLMVTSNDGRKVPVVQAYAFGKYLGYLKVTFDEAGNVINAVGNPILMNSSIPQGTVDCNDGLNVRYYTRPMLDVWLLFHQLKG